MNAHDPHDPIATDATSLPADLAAMLFLGDELPVNERNAFDARLASDPALRAEVESLGSIDAMLRTDAARPTDVSPSVSDRALASSLRLMRERSILQRQSRAPSYSRYFQRVPRWAWASSVAAALAVGFILWVVSTDPTPITVTASREPPMDDRVTAAFSDIQAVTLNDSDDGGADANEQINALEILSHMSADDSN